MEHNPSKVRALRELLLDPDHLEGAMGVVALTPDVTDDMLSQILAEYRERCERICEAMDDLTFEDDESEAEKHIPLTWLATRYEWARLNDQMQYQTMLKGQADPMTMARASMLSKIAEKLEILQTRQELFWTLKLAADPFGTVSRIPRLANRLMEATGSAGEGMNEVLHELYSIRDYVADHLADREFLAKLDKSISRSIQSVESSGGIQLDDLHAALEVEVVGHLATCEVTALIESRNRDPSALIPPDVCDLFFAAARRWLAHIFERSIERTPAEREAAGKSAHLTFCWSLERSERKLTFTLRDDGIGASDFQLAKHELPPGLFASWSNTPGAGSELIIESNFMLSGNAEYLIFSVFNGEGSSALAIPAQHVSQIEMVDPGRLACAANVLIMGNGDHYRVLDTSMAVFGARADQQSNLVIFADLGEAGRLAVRAEELHGITRGRVKPLPFDNGTRRVAGVLSNGSELVMVLDIEELFSA